jgi:NAD(P)-dependent dehydrogenase (short-subunit alcohol dehydrogenase family)
MDLKDKVIVVTGGASGLGQATCREFVAKGAKAFIFDLNEELSKATVAELGEENAAYAVVDVTDETSVQAGIDAALGVFGAIHVVLNAAGIGPPMKVLDRDGNALPLAKFATIVNINLMGTFNVLSKAAAVMAKNVPFDDDGGRGVIINVASAAAFDGQIGQPAYAASKAGVCGMTLPIAREFQRYGIRVNAIAPGLFLTPLANTLPAEVVTALGNTVEYPKRLGVPAEFGKMVVSLAENDYMNGEVVRIDGALRMRAK